MTCSPPHHTHLILQITNLLPVYLSYAATAGSIASFFVESDAAAADDADFDAAKLRARIVFRH